MNTRPIMISRRSFLQSSAACAVAMAIAPTLAGCGKGGINQAQLAALAQTLGNSAANLATITGNPALASKITELTSQAVGDIQVWKSGDTTTDIIQVLGDLETVINQIPVSQTTQALITLALGTIQGILALFPPAAAAVQARAATSVPRVALAKVPKTSKDYAAQWNSEVNANPATSKKLLIQ